MNIYNLFGNSAKNHPEFTAIIKGDNSITFGELEKQIDQTVHYFKAAGIQKGDRVMVFVPMSIDLYRIVLALFKIGATAVFLDEWVNWKRLNVCCKLADCKAFIAGFKISFLGIFSKEIRNIPIKLKVNGFKKYTEFPSIADVVSDHPALITFTTGSTGTPKAALRSHNFLQQQFNVLYEEIDPKPGEVCLTTLPILVFINLGSAVTTVLTSADNRDPALIKVGEIIHELNSYKVERIIASPHFVKQLSKGILKSKNTVPTLQSLFTGGAPVFPNDAALFVNAFSAADINIVYGSTEAEPISLIKAKELITSPEEEIGLDAGMINEHVKVRIIRISDEVLTWRSMEDLTDVQPAIAGEIIVSGPHVLDQYFRNPEAIFRNKITDPYGNIWHRTGDSGYLIQNNVFLTGRCNTIFDYNGQDIFPFIFENKLSQINGLIIGTIILKEGLPVIVAEVAPDAKPEEVTAEINKINYLNAGIKFIKKMPRDPRHHSKIDYARL